MATQTLASSKKRYRDFRSDLPKSEQEVEAAKNANPNDPRNDPQKKPAKPEPKDKERRRKYVKHYFAWLRPYFRGLAIVLFLGLLSAAFTFVQPILTQKIIDHAILADGLERGERIGRINLFGFLMIGMAVASVLVAALRGRIFNVINHLAVIRLRQRLLDHTLHLPLNQLAEMKTGGVVSRLNTDVNQAMMLVQYAIILPGTALLQAIAAATIIFFINAQLALASVAITIPLVFLHWYYIRRIRPLWKSVQDDIQTLDGRATETFTGIRVVRAFRRETRGKRDDAVLHDTAMRKSLFATLLDLLINSGWNVLAPGITLVIVWYGGYLIIRDQTAGVSNPTTVGDLFAFQGYVMLLLSPVMQLVNSISMTQRSLAATERVFDVLDKPRDKPDKADAREAEAVLQPIPPATLAGVRELRFDHVTFGYQKDKEPVIQDFDLTVPGGSVVALVGASGAGKTTLTDLIARFHDPTEGAIRLNGVDLRDIKLKSYRRLLAVVQQETFLFDGTVRENIAYGRRHATEEQIIDAAKRANAWEFIEKLPKGLDTQVGERGVKLSGGQKQRMSIARAILADPHILILDEATSNLDTHSEQLIQAALDELFQERTTFIIAHRLSTITHSDMIVVMDKGRLVQVGKHDELMAAGPGTLYHDMVEKQRAAFEDSTPVSPSPAQAHQRENIRAA